MFGDFKCKHCGKLNNKEMDNKTHEKKCESRNLMVFCKFCRQKFKKYGILNHQKSCKTMMCSQAVENEVAYLAVSA